MLSLHSSMYATTHEAIEHCKQEHRCIVCGEKFSDENVFTEAGARETMITQMCEICYDAAFEDMDDEEF